MNCKKCEHPLPDNAEFCEYCGTFTGENGGTYLNGVRIETKEYNDAEPFSSSTEKIFAGFGSKDDLPGLNKKRPGQPKKEKRDTASSEYTAAPERTSTGSHAAGTRLNRRRGPDHTDLNGTGTGAQDLLHRLIAAIAYLGWAGFLIACIIGHRKDSFIRYHLNTALTLNLLCTLVNVLYRFSGFFSVIAFVLAFFCLIGIFAGILAAIKGKTKSLAFLGRFRWFR